MRTTLTAFIHGPSGVGKSWLADTVPAPRLILDSEGRAKYTPSGPKVGWDPRQGPPPAADGTWETCVAAVPDFETMTLAFQWLRSGQHQFTSIVIDSLMEVQKRCVDAVAGANLMEIQDWGSLLRRMETLVRSYRDLTLLPTNPADVVVFVGGSREVDGKYRPLLQGQLADTLPYYLDVVGYLFMQPSQDETGQPTYVRSLLVQPQPGFIAKDGTGRLPGPVISNPNLSELVELLHVNGKPEAVTAPAEGAVQ